MANNVERLDLAGIVGEVDDRVDGYGARSVIIDVFTQKARLIVLSRAGRLAPGTPEQAQPSTPCPDLAVVKEYIGDEEDPYAPGYAQVSKALSHEYVIAPDSDGRLRAYDALGASTYDADTRTTAYFLDAARAVESGEEILAVRGLITAFDAALDLERQA